ncbi:MAG TPA: alpha/beta fold hydrolase [Syntrophorhabdaceae bacterium]|jgi:predicted esterase
MIRKRRVKYLLVLIAALFGMIASGLPAAFAEPAGVILLHGKGSSANPLVPLAETLREKGFQVVVPAMPYGAPVWKDTYEENVPIIMREVEALKKQGVTRVFLAGHSLGANVALYVATKITFDGVIAIAAGHVPEAKGYVAQVQDDVARAKKMVSEGRGDEVVMFDDYNQGRKLARKATPRVYLSYVDPEGPAVMPRNAANLKPGTAFFWIVGSRDGMAKRGPSYAFDKAPPNPRSKYLVIESDHFSTPTDGKAEIVEWLKSFEAASTPSGEQK